MACAQGCLLLEVAGPQISKPMYPRIKVQVKSEHQSEDKSLLVPDDDDIIDETSETVERSTITLLQEFIQTSRSFNIPQGMPALQWNFDARITRTSRNKFRAQVAFLLDGIPHFVMGGWGASKKQARRDVARECLHFFIGSWSSLFSEGQLETRSGVWTPEGVEEALVHFYQANHFLHGEPPRWSLEMDHPGGNVQYKALLRLQVLGVPHTFAGKFCRTPAAAKVDAAKRVLWYFQCPGFQDAFEVDPKAFATKVGLPAPSVQWPWGGKDASETVESSPLEAA